MTPLRRPGLLLVATVVLAGLLPGSAAARPAGPATTTADRYTPLIQRVPTTPRWFRAPDRRIHLAYELRLFNGLSAPVELKVVTVRASGRKRPLLQLRGAKLLAATTPLASPTDDSTTVAGSGTSVVWLEVVLRRGARVPRAVRHRITLTVPPGLPLHRRITEAGARARVDQRRPTVLGPPLRGPGWIAVGSCCDGPHRRAMQPVNGREQLAQRFAVDWNGMDAQSRWVVGDPDRNRSWVFFGKPVLAVADAEVVAAVDRYPDQIPNHPGPVTIRSADGNHVILKLGPGHYVSYAHLVPGSVKVHKGQRVREGQVIGRLGNSGSSTGPHLHIQLSTRPSFLAGDGLPFAIRSFRLQGQIPPLSEALQATVNAGGATPPTGPKGRKRNVLPVGRDVVAFRR